jgi:signal transduction histidine kinase
MPHTTTALGDLEAARMALARLRRAESDSLPRLLDRALEICSRALHVGRVGVWLLDASIPGLRCIHLYDTEDPAARPGEVLLEADLGAYAASIAERNYIASRDVRTNPHTADLVAHYFAAHGIVSTLDVPFYRDGEVAGVICHEHRGDARDWTAAEAAFAQCVAEIVAHALTAEDLIAALEALQQYERLQQEALRERALTRVARGIAHDLGNTLQSIALQTECLRAVADDPESVREAAARILDLGRHAKAVLQGMRDYAAGDHTQLAPVVIDEALDGAHSTLRALAGEDRAVTLTPGAPGAVVQVSPTGFARALANLVVNAREATAPGGVIAVTTACDGDAVYVAVQDDGRGMDEATRQRVFEPFFSTHSDDPQRGFGLSIVAAVVRAAGGTVTVESAPGQGARFVLRLPRG